MILIEQIASFVRDFSKGRFCDDCLREMLDISSVARVSRFTDALAASREFERETGSCTVCGNEKQLIRAVPGTNSHPLKLVELYNSDRPVL